MPPSSPPPLKPGLYIVATPIGNLGDITLRALDVLRAVDIIACEDTRVSRTLLERYGCKGKRIAYHDHSDASARNRVLDDIRRGKAVALISDAGTPLIADPGYKLVRDARNAEIMVTHLPGASALTTALTLAAQPTDRIFFAGFLPSKLSARRKALEKDAELHATLVYYESPKRLPESLSDIADIFGSRSGSVLRELTKLHEEVRTAPLSELAEHYRKAGPPKGEVVIVIAPPEPGAAPSENSVDAALRMAMKNASVRDASAEVAARLNLPKKDVYARALKLKNN